MDELHVYSCLNILLQLCAILFLEIFFRLIINIELGNATTMNI